MHLDLLVLITSVGVIMFLIPAAHGDISVYSLDTRDIQVEIDDSPSLFGGNIPLDGLRGLLVYASPVDACSAVDPPPPHFGNFYGKWILLTKRYGCNFDVKVRSAQAAGYHAVIVHNVNSSKIEPMASDNSSGITIPSVFVNSDDGAQLRDNYQYDSGFYLCINHDLPYDITIHMLLIFSILVGLCFLGMIVFIVIKYLKDRRRQRRHRLPKSSLEQITIHKFRKNDPYDTCAICLEDYVEGEKLRVLPCLHAYHMKCIDPWLTNNRRVCPVCKRRVLLGDERDSDDTDSDSDEENRPLLRGDAAARSSNDLPTSDTVTRSTFHRIRSRMLGLAESVASSISSYESMSTSASTEHEASSREPSLRVDVEESADTRSLAEEPSVNA